RGELLRSRLYPNTSGHVMPASNAQRQARYRQRRDAGLVNISLDVDARLLAVALDRSGFCVTQDRAGLAKGVNDSHRSGRQGPPPSGAGDASQKGFGETQTEAGLQEQNSWFTHW